MRHPEVQECVIIGSGPAGLTAAIYTARAGLTPIVIGGVEFGGQLMTTTLVENYPGFPNGIQGPELVQSFIQQAEKYGAKMQYQNATRVDFSQLPYKVFTDQTSYLTGSVIIAVGSKPRRLGLPAEEQLWGKGVTACATCDGALYRDQVVAVIGGGDSAMEEALFLTRFASKVYIIHRRDQFRASKIMQDKVFAHPKIEVVWNSVVDDIKGEKFVEALVLSNTQSKAKTELLVAGIFLAIGHIPMTNPFVDQVDLDQQGYVKVSGEVHTSQSGVFAAGDVADPTYQQVVTAAGMGCKAAIECEKYLSHAK